MTLRLTPKSGSIVDILSDIASANKISHFNLIGYTHREQTDYSIQGGDLNFTNLVHSTVVREKIASAVVQVESSKDSYVAVSSLVRLNDSKPAHIFQLDFDGALPVENFETFFKKLDGVSSIFDTLQGRPFYLVSSGSGYHVYGGAVRYEAFPRMLDALRKSGIADTKWLDLSSAQGFSDLRISKNLTKPSVPTMIGIIS